MSQKIKRTFATLLSIAFGLFLAQDANSGGTSQVGTPKTSQHESFKPENFPRLAVIVKPFKAQQGFNMMTGMGGGNRQDQTQMERMVEQRFLRVLLGNGYTLVSRADLDAAMKEKGLDKADLTDEKLTEEAGKLLHASAIMVVSVDDYKTTPVQGTAANRQPNMFGMQQTTTFYQIVASISARVVKIDDNMVMWTGDLTLNKSYSNMDQDSVVLGMVAEAVAASFPPLTPPKKVTDVDHHTNGY